MQKFPIPVMSAATISVSSLQLQEVKEACRLRPLLLLRPRPRRLRLSRLGVRSNILVPGFSLEVQKFLLKTSRENFKSILGPGNSWAQNLVSNGQFLIVTSN